MANKVQQVMAKFDANSPLDFMGVYISANIGVGQKLKLETTQKRLARLPLFPVLDVLAQISFKADKARGSDDAEALAQNLLRPAHAAQAVRLIKSGRREKYHVVSSQMAVGLALLALDVCEYEEYDGEFDMQELVHDVSDLILALSALMDDQKVTTDTLIMELVRMELWARVNDYDRWHELCHRIVLEILPTLSDDVDWIDVNALIKEAAGIELGDFWALTNAMAISVNGSFDMYKFPPKIPNSVLSKEIIDKWTKHWSTGLDEARAAAKNDILDTRLWSFSAFYERPLLNLGNGIIMVIRPWFLANKATPAGFFSTIEAIIRDKWAAAKNDKERTKEFLKWSRLFGKATEIMARKLIEEHIPNVNRVDEDNMDARWPGVKGKSKSKGCDTVLLGDNWVPIDFVYRRMNKMTTTTGNINDLAKDLNAGVIEKLQQIDDTLSRALKMDGEPSGFIYPVVVVGAPFAVNGLLLNEIDRRAEKVGMNIVGTHPKCKSPMVLDLEEYWMLIETAGYHNMHPAELLEAWIASPLRVSNFRNWLVTNGPAQAPLAKRRSYADHSMERIFGEDAVKRWYEEQNKEAER